jgi:hypothetical protein
MTIEERKEQRRLSRALYEDGDDKSTVNKPDELFIVDFLRSFVEGVETSIDVNLRDAELNEADKQEHDVLIQDARFRDGFVNFMEKISGDK